MAVIEFRTLGTLDLRRADGLELHTLLAQPKRVALLAYLCMASPRGFHRRDTLLGLFWPDADQSHARASLRNALHVLRHSLGETAIQARGDAEIGVDFGVISCDVVEFERKIAAGEFEAALELYRGDFLTGFYLEDVALFERWLEAERARLRGAAAQAALDASLLGDADRNLTSSVSWARRAVALASTDERAIRRLIEALANVGDRGAAFQAYEEFARYLSSEFDAEPSAETRALVDRVRSGGSGVPRPGQGADLPSGQPWVRSDASGAASASSEPSMVSAPRKRGRLSRLAAVALAVVVVVLFVFARGISGDRGDPGTQTRIKLTAAGNAIMASLSPDGRSLAYVIKQGDSQQVVLQDLSGGPPNTIGRFGLVIWSLEWSPDGSRLAIGGSRRGVALSRVGGTTTNIGPRIGGQAMIYWLPDSTRFSLHDAGDRRVLVFDPKTQDSLMLPVTGGYTWMLQGSWSPTGRVFAVITETGDPVSWELRTVTTERVNHLVLKDTIHIDSPRWSADGNALYYARGRDEIWRIAVSSISGEPRGVPERVLNNLEMYSHRFGMVHFALAANGKSVLYPKGARFSNLWLVEKGRDGSRPTTSPLTTGTSLRWSPVVSPDGTLVAFAQETSAGGELFTVPITGGDHAVQITQGARVRPEARIAWSPDGTQIAFSSIRSGHAQILAARISDGVMRAFESTRISTATGHLTWAPGSAIAYQRTDHQSVNSVDPVSGKESVLIRDSTLGAIHSPAYSPDGSRLAVFWFRVGGGESGVYVVDLRRSRAARVGSGLYPRGWSPDGRYIYFQWPQGPVVYRLDSRSDRKESPPTLGTPDADFLPKSQEEFLAPPFQQAECTPVGVTRPDTFVCAAFDFASDIWRVDNFDENAQ